MAEPWVSVEQFCSVHHVYSWLARRGSRGHRIGRVWRYKASEVDAWVPTSGADALAEKAAG